MIPAEFDAQFNRLTSHFHLPVDENREQVALDWLKALEHYHIDALEYAVTELIRTAQDRFWPPLGKVLALIQGRMGRYDRTISKCATCHGSTWIDVAPWKSNGMIYAGLVRCPDCGIPAPPTHDRPMTQGLTSTEYHAWREGERADQMPEGSKAKPWKPGAKEAHKAEMYAFFERLKIKMFGKDVA